MPAPSCIRVTLASGGQTSIATSHIGLIVARRPGYGCVIWSPDFRMRYRVKESAQQVTSLLDKARGITPP